MRLIKRILSLIFSIIFTIVILAVIIVGIIYLISKMESKKFKITSENSIGVIKIESIIRDSSKIIKNLKKFTKNKKIKAIILKINSPGGAVVPSQEIYREIIRLKKQKKIFAYIQSVGASGAYYIASACDKIFANPGSIVGSIGVIAEFINVKELLEKIGIKSITIKSGKFKDTGNPDREMTEEEREYLKGLVMNIYNQFLLDVSKSRNIPIENLKKIADGRVFTGKDALKLKLVDKLGNFDDVIDYVKNICKIKGEPQIVYPKESKSILREVVDSIEEFIHFKEKVKFMYLYEN